MMCMFVLKLPSFTMRKSDQDFEDLEHDLEHKLVVCGLYEIQ